MFFLFCNQSITSANSCSAATGKSSKGKLTFHDLYEKSDDELRRFLSMPPISLESESSDMRLLLGAFQILKKLCENIDNNPSNTSTNTSNNTNTANNSYMSTAATPTTSMYKFPSTSSAHNIPAKVAATTDNAPTSTTTTTTSTSTTSAKRRLDLDLQLNGNTPNTAATLHTASQSNATTPNNASKNLTFTYTAPPKSQKTSESSQGNMTYHMSFVIFLFSFSRVEWQQSDHAATNAQALHRHAQRPPPHKQSAHTGGSGGRSCRRCTGRLVVRQDIGRHVRRRPSGGIARSEEQLL